jgi:hypothetical protein
MRVRTKDLSAREMDGELVLLDLVGSRYLAVTGVGVRIFELLAVDRSTNELVRTVVEEYDVDEEVARVDIDAFLQRLRDHHLLED